MQVASRMVVDDDMYVSVFVVLWCICCDFWGFKGGRGGEGMKQNGDNWCAQQLSHPRTLALGRIVTTLLLNRSVPCVSFCLVLVELPSLLWTIAAFAVLIWEVSAAQFFPGLCQFRARNFLRAHQFLAPDPLA